MHLITLQPMLYVLAAHVTARWRSSRILAFAGVLTAAVVVLVIGVASPAHCSRKVVIVVANRLTLSDIVAIHPPALSRLASDGAIGLLSPNCLGYKTEKSVTLSAISGVRSMAGDYLGQIFASDEQVPGDMIASASYELRTGMTARRGSLLFLELAAAHRDNILQFSFATGELADAIHRAGMTTGGIGNADMPGRPDRSALVLAVDSTGRGDQGITHVPVLYGSTGACSDPNKLAELARRIAQRAELTVVCFPDLVWLDGLPNCGIETIQPESRADAVNRLDRLVSNIRAKMAHDSVLIVVSFGPPIGHPWRELTPIIVYPAIGRVGVLTSLSTRTAGVIAATDFSPTVLQLLGVPGLDTMIGRPAISQAAADPTALLTEINTRAGDNRRLMAPLGLVFAAVGAISFTIAGVGPAFSLRLKRWVTDTASIGIIVLTTGPLALLVAGLAPPGMASYTIACALVSAALTAAALKVRYLVMKRPTPCRSAPLVFIYGLSAVLILADGFSSGSLCRWAMPSSFHLSGLRFYGLGNEYAGFLIGMGVSAFAMQVACGEAQMRVCRWLSVAAGVLTIVVLGISRFGANYGAVIASAVAYCLLWRALFGGRIRVRDVAWACVFAVAALAAFFAADSIIWGNTGSHAAQTARISQVVGKDYILELVSRKIVMNISLLVSPHTVWVLFAFVPFLMLWLVRLRRKAWVAYGDRVESAQSYLAVAIGAAAAFVFNDSGAVMASIMLATVFAPILYVLNESGSLEERA